MATSRSSPVTISSLGRSRRASSLMALCHGRVPDANLRSNEVPAIGGYPMKLLSALLLGALIVAIPASAQVFTAGPGLALAIPDNVYTGTVGTMGCSTIAVPSGGGGGDSVANVIVTIAQSHTWVGDLTIKLIGPTGIVTTLVSRPGVVET